MWGCDDDRVHTHDARVHHRVHENVGHAALRVYVRTVSDVQQNHGLRDDGATVSGSGSATHTRPGGAPPMNEGFGGGHRVPHAPQVCHIGCNSSAMATNDVPHGVNATAPRQLSYVPQCFHRVSSESNEESTRRPHTLPGKQSDCACASHPNRNPQRKRSPHRSIHWMSNRQRLSSERPHIQWWWHTQWIAVYDTPPSQHVHWMG